MIVSTNSFSQQEPRSAFFWNQYMHTNPAMTGAVYRHHANVQWRNQWVNTNGAPTTLWANYAAKLDQINSGIGVSYEYDVIGWGRTHTALVSYAYHIPIKNMFLSFGASAGVKTRRFKPVGLMLPEVQNDPVLMERAYKPAFQCDFGIALHGEKLNLGLSVTQLNGATFRDSVFSTKDKPNIWLFAGYTFNLGEKWKLTPRLQSYTDGLQIATTVALIASVKDNFWFGATSTIPAGGGRLSAGPVVGYDIAGKFRLGYAYEFWFNMGPSATYNGTHEIILSYQLK